MHKIVLGITGASGAIYAKVLLDKLVKIKEQMTIARTQLAFRALQGVAKVRSCYGVDDVLLADAAVSRAFKRKLSHSLTLNGVDEAVHRSLS